MATSWGVATLPTGPAPACACEHRGVAFIRRDGYVLWVGGPVPRGSRAITIGRVISVRRGDERSPYLIRHELVHVRQWRRYGYVGFLARYTFSYLRGRTRGYPHRAA